MRNINLIEKKKKNPSASLPIFDSSRTGNLRMQAGSADICMEPWKHEALGRLLFATLKLPATGPVCYFDGAFGAASSLYLISQGGGKHAGAVRVSAVPTRSAETQRL